MMSNGLSQTSADRIGVQAQFGAAVGQFAHKRLAHPRAWRVREFVGIQLDPVGGAGLFSGNVRGDLRDRGRNFVIQIKGFHFLLIPVRALSQRIPKRRAAALRASRC